MGLETQIKLPVIEFSEENLSPGSSAWASSCIEIRRALEEYGCFEAKFEKMSRRIYDAAFAGAEELFGLPTEVKMRNTSTKPYFEYFGQYKTLPLYESMAIDHPTSLDAATSFTNIMWPAGNDRFRESAQSYSELVTELDRTVSRMLFDSYGVGYYYDYYSQNTNYLLRYFKYNEPSVDQSNEGLLPHADKTFFSIIHQGKVSGLQVKVKEDQWIDVLPSPTSFVFMAGEALMAWSNDRIPSCYHQVILNEPGTRYSLGTFSFITGTIHIPKELVDDTHPIKYKPFDHFQFLQFVKENLGKHSNPCLIKAFAGV